MVRVYLSGNPIHDAVLKAFHEGCSDSVLITGWKYEPSDVAVVFGIYKSKIPLSYPRGQIISRQRAKNLDAIVLETGYINRGDGKTHHYAAGWNGLNGRADFRNQDAIPDRWEKLGITLKPWRKDGEHILLCGQVPWDASVDHSDHLEWLKQAEEKIRLLTRRPIIFRPHPKALLPPIKGCEYSTGSLKEDLKRAWCVVTFNSNSGVESVIEGIPSLAFDKGSMVMEIAGGWDDLNNPPTPNREQWAYNLAYTQWTIEEMRNGETWEHLR